MVSKIVKVFSFIFLYFPFLVKEMLRSGILVARVILSKNKINPGMLSVKKMSSKNASVIYANSITLTPGTYTIEIGSGNLLIHSIDKSEKENITMRKKIEDLLCWT